MQLLPEEVPLSNSPLGSAVRGQRVVPSSPLTRRHMADKIAAHRKLIPYGGVSQR